jgi:hypothetical protein
VKNSQGRLRLHRECATRRPPTAERLERLEALVTKDLVNDVGAREAVLGLKKKPIFKISKIFEEYEVEKRDQVLRFRLN